MRHYDTHMIRLHDCCMNLMDRSRQAALQVMHASGKAIDVARAGVHNDDGNREFEGIHHIH
jgi:hypothetical protein